MKCKPTEMQTKYYSFLLKHLKNMSKLMLLQNNLLKTQSVTSLIIFIKIHKDKDKDGWMDRKTT